MNIKLRIWRQANAQAEGKLVEYQLNDVSANMSFLEMMDVLNEQLISKGETPVAFDHDCREGICGTCSMYINGRAHGPQKLSTTCQLYMRNFTDGETITIEPFRAKGFPVLKDLCVDRSAFDRIIAAGGYISAATGQAQDANAIPVEKAAADSAMDLALLPQGHPERKKRALAMVAQMDAEGFGSCTNTYACEAECPKGISVANIARLNREYLNASIFSEEMPK